MTKLKAAVFVDRKGIFIFTCKALFLVLSPSPSCFGSTITLHFVVPFSRTFIPSLYWWHKYLVLCRCSNGTSALQHFVVLFFSKPQKSSFLYTSKNVKRGVLFGSCWRTDLRITCCYPSSPLKSKSIEIKCKLKK